MIASLNRLVDLVEDDLAADVDLPAAARTLGTTEYHLRRMFASLAGMPLSEYVRRRRMTVAAADLVVGAGDLLGVAVRHGYGSTEAFGRAFRSVHGAGPAQVRRDGGPLRSQPRLRFRLTVEGARPMDVRIAHQPAFRLVGHAARVPLVHHGVNPAIARAGPEVVAVLDRAPDLSTATVRGTAVQGSLREVRRILHSPPRSVGGLTSSAACAQAGRAVQPAPPRSRPGGRAPPAGP